MFSEREIVYIFSSCSVGLWLLSSRAT